MLSLCHLLQGDVELEDVFLSGRPPAQHPLPGWTHDATATTSYQVDS